MKIKNAPVVSNRDEYIHAAVRLGTDREYHQFISEQIRERGDILFDQPGVIYQFESFFETVAGNI